MCRFTWPRPPCRQPWSSNDGPQQPTAARMVRFSIFLVAQLFLVHGRHSPPTCAMRVCSHAIEAHPLNVAPRLCAQCKTVFFFHCPVTWPSHAPLPSGYQSPPPTRYVTDSIESRLIDNSQPLPCLPLDFWGADALRYPLCTFRIFEL